jgi:hypothetical protein
MAHRVISLRRKLWSLLAHRVIRGTATFCPLLDDIVAKVFLHC